MGAMKLGDYIRKSDSTRASLARAIGVNPAYLYQMERGLRAVSPARAVLLERATHGAVTRKDLRPNDWHLIWPELVDMSRLATREDRKISELVLVIVRRHLYGNIGCPGEDFHGASSADAAREQ